MRRPTHAELTQLTDTLARRAGRYLARQRWLARDAENSYLVGDECEGGPMAELMGASITYRIAVGPQHGRTVLTLQTLPAGDEPGDDRVGKVAGFSLPAGVAARAQERKKRERLCRYISRPPVVEKRLSLTAGGNVRYRLKTPYRDGTTHVIFEPLALMAYLRVRHPVGAACGGPLRLSCRGVIARLAALVPKPRVNPTRFEARRPWRAPARAHAVHPDSLPVNRSRRRRREQSLSSARDRRSSGARATTTARGGIRGNRPPPSAARR